MATAPITYTISYKTTWAGAWTAADADLFLDSLNFRVAPAIGQALLSRDYGYISRPAGTGVVTALDLSGKYVKIVITDGTNTDTWYGYCPTQVDAIKGSHPQPGAPATTVYSGRNRYTCYGLEYLLKSTPIDRCYAVPAAGGNAVALRRPLPFNGTSRFCNTQIVGRRSTAVDPVAGVYVHDPAGTTQWTARQVVDHLLYTFYATYGLQFTLAGQHAYLDNITEPWGVLEGSYYDALCALILPSRGFTFYLSAGTTINVVSISDAAVGSHIPANPNVVTLSLDTSTQMGTAEITHLENVHFDRIEVRGEPLRVCFTMKAAWGNLGTNWPASLETSYGTATDEERRQEQYERVFCRFKLPDAWDGTANGEQCLPVINETTGLADFTSQQKYFIPYMVLDRTLPIVDSATRQPKKPMLWIKDAQNKYRRVSKPDEESDLKSAGVRMLDDGPGFQIDPPYPHYYGKNDFAGTSEDEAELDWTELIATVALYTDERVRVVVDALTAEPGELERRKIIEVDGCHLWYTIKGTVTDATASALTTAGSNTKERDDTAILLRIADLARIWYGRRRAAIGVRWNSPYVITRLGQVIMETYAGGSVVPTGTVITRIDYDFNSQSVELGTEWFDLNLRGLVRGNVAGGYGGSVDRRLTALGDQLASVPVDFAQGGAGGGGDVACKVTAGTGKTYTVDVYAAGHYNDAGTEQAATASGKTLHIDQISAAETLPVNTFVRARKVGTHYEGVVPIWL